VVATARGSTGPRRDAVSAEGRRGAAARRREDAAGEESAAGRPRIPSAHRSTAAESPLIARISTAPRRLARARLRSRYRGASWVGWMDASRLNDNSIFLFGRENRNARSQLRGSLLTVSSILRRLPPSTCDLYGRFHVMVKQWLLLFVRKYLFFSPVVNVVMPQQ
jgi:hypothetical protein